jgi:cell division protein FtsZ
MREMGDALMGTGVATGEHRASEAASNAISSPLLDGVSIAGAQGVLVNVTGGTTMSLAELDEATMIIHDAAGDDANVILGAVIDENLTDELMVTVIATGFNKKAALARPVKTGVKVLDRIPSGLQDLQKLDEPTYIRKGIPLSNTFNINEGPGQKIDKADPEKPAFLRKIMD